MATHHITEEMVKNSPKFQETDCYRYLIENPLAVCVAHKANFDRTIIEQEGIKIERYIDTLAVAKHVLQSNQPESFSLQYLRYFLELDKLHEGESLGGYAHSALYDTIVLRWLYQYLYAKIHKLQPTADVVERMIQMTHEPILLERMKFGKYTGIKFSELAEKDYSYLTWVEHSQLEKPEHDRDLDTLHTVQYYMRKEKERAQAVRDQKGLQ